ncbi:hypothetical protein N2603_09065 [Bradyrhizobium huanghuaihaiense]|uniref:hypothetical protein n=1 Tax=Bradyrhizobium huanghuaihaiense TaxID=990078 RepID=UPI0021AA3A06|nr:hypothetical protein [Bradyrhizobium sp. CB3035]UWU81613.1 hypothetical protein N2603_09065 [Bradyrhizobium sp. CB3035]
MPFSAATGATDAARAGLDVTRQIDTTAAVIHRTFVCGFGMGSSSGLADDVGTLLSANGPYQLAPAEGA